jgi:amino acid transporter
LTILSYTATAVVSAASAVEYASQLVTLHSIPATILVLGVFALLTVLGVRESASVAAIIFVLHLVSMFLLAFSGIVFIFSNNASIFIQNFNAPIPSRRVQPISSQSSLSRVTHGCSLPQTILYGFASGMLGVTGFETAANYVEECKPGVFQKILRNLWWTVFLINPLMSIVTLGVLDLSTVKAHPNSVLAALATRAGGPTFGSWIAFDAFFVLSG